MANPPEMEVDFHAGVDYAKIRRIVREEIDLAIKNLFQAAQAVTKKSEN